MRKDEKRAVEGKARVDISRKILTVILAIMITVVMMPNYIFTTFAAEEASGQVRVTIKNTIWETADGAPWSGTLAEASVTINGDSTLKSLIDDALAAEHIVAATISDDELIAVNGLSNVDAGVDCHWLTVIDNREIGSRMSDYSAAKANIKDSSRIEVKYVGSIDEAIEQDKETAGEDGDDNGDDNGDEDSKNDSEVAGGTLRDNNGDVSATPQDNNGDVSEKAEGGLEASSQGNDESGMIDYSSGNTGAITSAKEEPAFMVDVCTGALLADEEAEWSNFRNSDSNMAITDAQTPKSAAETTLLWNAEFGKNGGMSGDIPSVQIIVDGYIITMAGKKIYKLNKYTGEIVAIGTMLATANWGYTPPIYADGMIFCPLANGTIQAFSTKTLKSLWVYKDPLGGQSLSPISYANGCIYTGFWNNYQADANYVCIDITDENPNKTNELKSALWTSKQKGGFYWNGSVAVGNAMIVGTCSDSNAKLISYDKASGKEIASVDFSAKGGLRSTISFDSASKRVYFTTSKGWLCSAKVSAQGVLSDVKSSHCGSMSSSTPVVYKGRAYFTADDKVVVADADTLQTIFKVSLKAKSQCSLLLSTAYEQEGYLYLYATYNGKPGGISVIKIKNDAAISADAKCSELYDAKGFEEFGIASIICSEDGTLYYRNDSGNVLAVGATTVEAVIYLIDKIGTVTLKSENDIANARRAYDKLTKEKQAQVTNYRKLTAAEKRLAELKAQQKQAEQKKKEKPGDKKLYTTKKQLSKSLTRSIAVSLSDSIKEVKQQIAALLNPENAADKLPDDYADLTKEQLAAIVKVYKAYQALSDDQRLLVDNYKDFKKVLNKLGRLLHRDAGSSITAEGIAWHYKLVVKPAQCTAEQTAKLREVLGEEASMLALYDICFEDIVSGEKHHPQKAVTLKLPEPEMTDYDEAVIVHINDEGRYEYIKCAVDGDELVFAAADFSLYGVAGIKGTWDDVMQPADDYSNKVAVIICVAIVVLALAAMTLLIYLRKKRNRV